MIRDFIDIDEAIRSGMYPFDVLGVVISEPDPASRAIGSALEDRSSGTTSGGLIRKTAEGVSEIEVVEVAQKHLETTAIADRFEQAECLVFASRHAGDTGRLLTAHVTGNFGPAEFGGTDYELASTPPNAVARAINELDKRAPEGYEVSLECTHHGPSNIGLPGFFIEIGSGPEQWAAPEPARAIAETIWALADIKPYREHTVIGFGGGHYAPRMTRLVKETPWAVGHIGAQWCLDALPEGTQRKQVLQSAFETSNARFACMDGEFPALEAEIDSLGYRVVSETWLRTVEDRPLDAVEAFEAHIGSLEAGWRFGDDRSPIAEKHPETLQSFSLDSELIETLNGVEQSAVIQAFTDFLPAYETTEAGNRATGNVALAEKALPTGLIDAFETMLEPTVDRLERTENGFIVTETTFDPNKARTLGVDPGPAFGALANGEAVDVGGRTIDPDAVTTTTTRNLPYFSA